MDFQFKQLAFIPEKMGGEGMHYELLATEELLSWLKNTKEQINIVYETGHITPLRFVREEVALLMQDKPVGTILWYQNPNSKYYRVVITTAPRVVFGIRFGS